MLNTGMDSQTGAQRAPTHQESLIAVLERIARAQEGMLAIAAEARQERLKLAAKMEAALKRPMEERG